MKSINCMVSSYLKRLQTRKMYNRLTAFGFRQNEGSVSSVQDTLVHFMYKVKYIYIEREREKKKNRN